MRFHRRHILMVFISGALMISLASGCTVRKGSDRILATINNYKMTVEDFNYESKEILQMGRLIGDIPDTKEEILDALIVKEVLLQEAQKENLDKDKEFMRAIEMYWEQTLIKNLMKNQFSDIHNRVTVYEEEILDYYNNVLQDKESSFEEARDRIAREIRGKKERKLLDEWIEKLRSKSRIKVDKRILNEL